MELERLLVFMGLSAVAATAAIVARRSAKTVHRITKSVALLPLFWIVAGFDAPDYPQGLILGALLFSLLGDVILTLAVRWFVAGLWSFFVALCLYAVAYWQGEAFDSARIFVVALALVVAGIILRSLWPHLGRLRVPALVYSGALMAVLSGAVGRLFSDVAPLGSSIVGALGAACFVASDTILIRRRRQLRSAPYAAELGLYFFAQWCLAILAWLA